MYLGFPDYNERLEILQIYGNNMKLEGLTLEDIAKTTENFTSTDVVALLKETRLKMVHEVYE